VTKEIVIWGLPAGETDRLHESVLSTQCKTEADIENLKARAAKDGWHSFRVTEFDPTLPPDFSSIFRKGK
jgi:hypothetical protein